VSSPTEPVHLSGSFPAPRLAVGVVAAVFICTSMIGFLHVLLLPDVSAGAVVLSAVCIAMLVLTQLRWYTHTHDSEQLRSPVGYAVLATQACLAYLPVLVFGQAWLGMPAFLAGSVLLVLRPSLAWPGFGLILASVGLAQWVFTARLADVLFTMIATVTTGLVVYGLSRLAALVTETWESRAEAARVAVLRERLRFARDLHDLLGYSLSAITLKIELTHRLMETSPREASNQLLEVLEISRLALSDARTVACGYREMSLEEECRSVVSVLSAADVAVRLEGDTADLPVQVNTVLATVLREGVTNLLRHSKAKHCEITIRKRCEHASIEVVNDSAAPQLANRGTGRGLRNLSVRAKEIGGRVTVTREGNVFRLHAEVPLRKARREAAAAARRHSQPAGVPGDTDGVDSVTRGELADDSGEIVPDGAD
jgi:two-component system sensor histidine kinase DesK